MLTVTELLMLKTLVQMYSVLKNSTVALIQITMVSLIKTMSVLK